MQKHRNTLFYIFSIVGFLILFYLIVRIGELNLQSGVSGIQQKFAGNSSWSNFWGSVSDNLSYSLAVLLLQIIVILCALRISGWFCRKIGQPAVIGEILAGIVLGPSLLGHYFPDIYNSIFPVKSLGSIQMLSQIGLILFMFIVGMELNLKTVRNRAGNAFLISSASIIFPFLCGGVLSYFLYPLYETNKISFLSFALFIGISMSITAFPVLARIVQERGIHKTQIGSIALTCAAINDITAWCALAAVIAIVKVGSFSSSLFVILLAIIYVAVMFKIVGPILQRVAERQTDKGKLSKTVIGFFLIILFVSSYITEIIGIHALFGAFLAGVIMPTSHKFRSLFTSKIEDIVLILFLPLFFVFTGLHTEIGLINSWGMWGICILITIVAMLGKLIGSTLAARFVHYPWKDSLTIGALMNTRGLMELVVLNIGRDLGVLSPPIFVMLVLMTLATTFMTSPILNIIDKIFGTRGSSSDKNDTQKSFSILCSFENKIEGKKLLNLSNAFIKKEPQDSELTMMFLVSDNTIGDENLEEEEKNMFEEIEAESKRISQKYNPLYSLAPEESSYIVKTANNGNYDLLLLEVRPSVFSGNIIGSIVNLSSHIFRFPASFINSVLHPSRKLGLSRIPESERISGIIAKSEVPVGIFMDKGLQTIKTVFLPIMDEEDAYLGEYMVRLASNSYIRFTLFDTVGMMDKSIEFIRNVREVKNVNPYLLAIWDSSIPVSNSLLEKQDIVIMSLRSWNKLQNSDYAWKDRLPSALVITN